MNCTAGPEVLGERAFRRHKVFAISGRTCELNTASDTAEGAVPSPKSGPSTIAVPFLQASFFAGGGRVAAQNSKTIDINNMR